MTSKDSIDSRDKQIHSDQNDSKGVKYGCIIFCLLSAFMIGVVINIVLTGIRTVEEILPHTDKNQFQYLKKEELKMKLRKLI